jgi:uncharacterized protein
MASTQHRPCKCPICGKQTDFFTEPAGPFCSARCKLIDLGRWFNEDYKFSDPLRPEHFAQYEELAEQLDPDRPEED